MSNSSPLVGEVNSNQYCESQRSAHCDNPIKFPTKSPFLNEVIYISDDESSGKDNPTECIPIPANIKVKSPRNKKKWDKLSNYNLRRNVEDVEVIHISDEELCHKDEAVSNRKTSFVDNGYFVDDTSQDKKSIESNPIDRKNPTKRKLTDADPISNWDGDYIMADNPAPDPANSPQYPASPDCSDCEDSSSCISSSSEHSPVKMVNELNRRKSWSERLSDVEFNSTLAMDREITQDVSLDKKKINLTPLMTSNVKQFSNIFLEGKCTKADKLKMYACVRLERIKLENSPHVSPIIKKIKSAPPAPIGQVASNCNFCLQGNCSNGETCLYQHDTLSLNKSHVISTTPSVKESHVTSTTPSVKENHVIRTTLKESRMNRTTPSMKASHVIRTTLKESHMNRTTPSMKASHVISTTPCLKENTTPWVKERHGIETAPSLKENHVTSTTPPVKENLFTNIGPPVKIGCVTSTAPSAKEPHVTSTTPFVKKIDMRKLCRFFYDSFCVKGKSCQFVHKKFPCKCLHIEGKCDDDNCKYLHEPLSLKQGLYGPLSPRESKSREKLYTLHLNGRCNNEENCPLVHKLFPCKAFHFNTHCFQGGECEFSHEPLNYESQQILELVLEANNEEKQDNIPKTIAKEHCSEKSRLRQGQVSKSVTDVPIPIEKRRFYQLHLNGKCTKGNSCRLVHKKFPCKSFHVDARCFQGGYCTFSHEPLNDQNRNILQQCLIADGLQDCDPAPSVARPSFSHIKEAAQTTNALHPPRCVYDNNFLNPDITPQMVRSRKMLLELPNRHPTIPSTDPRLRNADNSMSVDNPQLVIPNQNSFIDHSVRHLNFTSNEIRLVPNSQSLDRNADNYMSVDNPQLIIPVQTSFIDHRVRHPTFNDTRLVPNSQTQDINAEMFLNNAIPQLVGPMQTPSIVRYPNLVSTDPRLKSNSLSEEGMAGNFMSEMVSPMQTPFMEISVRQPSLTSNETNFKTNSLSQEDNRDNYSLMDMEIEDCEDTGYHASHHLNGRKPNIQSPLKMKKNPFELFIPNQPLADSHYEGLTTVENQCGESTMVKKIDNYSLMDMEIEDYEQTNSQAIKSNVEISLQKPKNLFELFTPKPQQQDSPAKVKITTDSHYGRSMLDKTIAAVDSVYSSDIAHLLTDAALKKSPSKFFGESPHRLNGTVQLKEKHHEKVVPLSDIELPTPLELSIPLPVPDFAKNPPLPDFEEPPPLPDFVEPPPLPDFVEPPPLPDFEEPPPLPDFVEPPPLPDFEEPPPLPDFIEPPPLPDFVEPPSLLDIKEPSLLSDFKGLLQLHDSSPRQISTAYSEIQQAIPILIPFLELLAKTSNIKESRNKIENGDSEFRSSVINCISLLPQLMQQLNTGDKVKESLTDVLKNLLEEVDKQNQHEEEPLAEPLAEPLPEPLAEPVHENNMAAAYSSSLNTPPKKKSSLCLLYLNSVCTEGDHCLFVHKDFPCMVFHTQKMCYEGDNCKFSHEPLTDDSLNMLEEFLNSIEDKESSEDQISIEQSHHGSSYINQNTEDSMRNPPSQLKPSRAISELSDPMKDFLSILNKSGPWLQDPRSSNENCEARIAQQLFQLHDQLLDIKPNVEPILSPTLSHHQSHLSQHISETATKSQRKRPSRFDSMVSHSRSDDYHNVHSKPSSSCPRAYKYEEREWLSYSKTNN